MNPEQWLSLKWNGGSTMSDRWLNQSKIIQQIKTIVLHLDNDKVGRLCTATLKELLQKDYKIVDDPPPVGKDFNDFLLSYLGITRPKPARERSDVR